MKSRVLLAVALAATAVALSAGAAEEVQPEGVKATIKQGATEMGHEIKEGATAVGKAVAKGAKVVGTATAREARKVKAAVISDKDNDKK